MQFRTSLILALSCIVAVSSQERDESTAFNDYEGLYRDALEEYVPTMPSLVRDRIVVNMFIKETENPNLDKTILDEVFVECFIIKHFLDIFKDETKLYNLVLLFYVKHLAGHYVFFAAESANKFREQAKSSGSEEDETLANNLDLMKYILEIYATNPSYEDFLEKIEELFLNGDNKDEVAEALVDVDKNRKFTKEEVENVRSDVEALFRKVLLFSPGKLSSLPKMSAAENFFKKLLSGSFIPHSGADNIPDEKKEEVKEAIAKLGLLESKPVTCSGKQYSRVVKIIQVLMIGDGSNVIKPLLD